MPTRTMARERAQFEGTIPRGVGRPKKASAPLFTILSDVLDAVSVELDKVNARRFPSAEYREDPVRFFREVLGVEPWSRQVEIIEAVRDHPRVAICSGHKISKSHTAAGLALWYYCSHVDARVVMSSTTARQVDQILWRELRMMRARSARCVACKAADPTGILIPRPCPHSVLIDGEQGELARTGLKSEDFREIVGFTAKEAEAVAGISGRNLLYILDEASGIPDAIFEAIEGNRAGGARVVMFGNGTRNEGEFFEAFHSKSRLYFTLRVSSEETPNVVEGREVIPGLATREWIEEKKIEWGVDSALYAVRVKGLHATLEEHKIFSLHVIEQAEQRWHTTADAGRLFIGLDPAGASGTGDETAFSVRRGLKHIALRRFRGLNDDAHLVHLLAMLSEFRLPRETPVVVLDREGPIGSSLAGKFAAHVELNPYVFELVLVRASDRAHRQPKVYDRVRDELAANLQAWLRDGGAILEDARLEKELHALEFKAATNGRLKLTPKTDLKKLLGGSPDAYDSLALSVWEPLSLNEPIAAAALSDEPANTNAYGIDPYAAGRAWRS